MAQKRRYGVGVQTFADMIERNCVYVDKTKYIWQMAQSGGKSFFLARPRRFGKSLLISTMKAYFEGRRELFRGLYIDKVEKEWTRYPVIRIDLSSGKYYELERLHGTIGGILRRLEEEWNVKCYDEYNYDDRLSNLILSAHEKTGQKVVVLIDEYDAPMLDSIGNPELQDQIRQRIRNLFSPLKAQGDHLRLVFLTGISKFSQLSVFSELNNLNTLTFDPAYEGICGITEEELLTQMRPDIEWLAEAMSELRPMTYDDCVAELKHRYDGYHFTDRMTDIYNPWSVVNAFEKGRIQNFWFSTGTPTSLIQLLQSKEMDLPLLEGFDVDMERFDMPTERISDPVPVLYQSGYLTIKAYHADTGEFTLGFPNREVYEGFAKSLYQYYSPESTGSRSAVASAFRKLRVKRITMQDFLEVVKKWYRGIPYSITAKNQNEQLYQSLLYALLAGCGADVQAEAQTSDGRMDIALKMPDAIYVLEFKYDKTVEAAMEQMERKDYGVLFAADPRPVYAVGLNIDSEQRSISSYDIAECKKS